MMITLHARRARSALERTQRRSEGTGEGRDFLWGILICCCLALRVAVWWGACFVRGVLFFVDVSFAAGGSVEEAATSYEVLLLRDGA